jgi:transcriptional regulator CtsR
MLDCNKIGSWETKIKYIAKKANGNGIKKSNLESLLENTIKNVLIEESVDRHKIIKDVYAKGNFGFRYIASPKYTEEKREKLIEKYGGVECVNFIDVPFEDNSELLLTIKKKIEDYFYKQQKNETTKDWHFQKYEKMAILRKFVIECISHNIPNEEVLEFMKGNFYPHNIDSYIAFFRDDFYVGGFHEFSRGIRRKPQTEKKK